MVLLCKDTVYLRVRFRQRSARFLVPTSLCLSQLFVSNCPLPTATFHLALFSCSSLFLRSIHLLFQSRVVIFLFTLHLVALFAIQVASRSGFGYGSQPPIFNLATHTRIHSTTLEQQIRTSHHDCAYTTPSPSISCHCF